MSTFLRFLILAWFLTGCASIPSDYPRTTTAALTATDDTSLGHSVTAWRDSHVGKSGYYPLSSGTDALGARLSLINQAERSIDLQYFLMKPDDAGLLLAASLKRAADRGVRIRILLDDIFTEVEDNDLLTLSAHANVEVRLFNPIARGGSFALNYLIGFERANRRMHNKSFIVDNQAGVIGGRNIADEYFELKSGSDFKDFDMLAIGPIAQQLSATFDRYWNHELSTPIEAFKSGQQGAKISEFRLSEERRSKAIVAYENALSSPLLKDLLEGQVQLYPATSYVIADDPDKLVQKVADKNNLLVSELAKRVAAATSELIIITPYLIPGAARVQLWRDLTDRSVRVVVLTNSLASNNHVAVHGAYSGYRRQLIKAGVELFELRTKPTGDANIPKATLHTKLAIIDRSITAVGSLNLDPRSIDLNTEIGTVIESTELGERIALQVLAQIPDAAYRVEEDAKGRLQWRSKTGDADVVFTREPDVSIWRRLQAWMSKLLPEGQL